MDFKIFATNDVGYGDVGDLTMTILRCSQSVSHRILQNHYAGRQHLKVQKYTRWLPKYNKKAVAEIGHLHEYAYGIYRCQNTTFSFSL